MLLIRRSFSLRLLSFLLLFFSFCVNLACERVFELESPKVYKEDVNGQERSGWSPIQKTCSQETHRASPVHRRAGDVEWKTRYGLIHQDAKIVAQEGAGNAQGVIRGQD